MTNDHIEVDLYEGAYGPTLRIDTQTATALAAVRDLLIVLAEGRVAGHDLAKDDRFVLSGIASIALTVGADRQELGLRKIKGHGGIDSILWVLDREGWRTRVGLVGGLLEASRPGHQYLTTEGQDDVLVELSFREGQCE